MAARGEWTGPRFFKVHRLTQTAQRIIRDRIQRNWSAPQIRREVRKRTGERIALRSLQNFCARFRLELKAHTNAADKTRVFAQAALKLGYKLTAAVEAQLLEVLLDAELAQMGPYNAGKLALGFAASRRKERELKLRTKVERRKVKVQEGPRKEKRGKGTASRKNGSGNQGSPAEAIREIFGITNEK